MIHIKRNICLVAVSCTLLAGIPLQGVAQTGRTAKVQATQSNKITVSDFQVLLEQAKAEMENIRREEERQKAEKERRDLQAENKMQDRDRSGFLR